MILALKFTRFPATNRLKQSQKAINGIIEIDVLIHPAIASVTCVLQAIRFVVNHCYGKNLVVLVDASVKLAPK